MIARIDSKPAVAFLATWLSLTACAPAVPPASRQAPMDSDAHPTAAPSVSAPPRPPAAPLPGGDAAAEGVDPAALERLLARARESDSAGLVVLKNGKVIADLVPDAQPIETMSATKSIVSLAIGTLLDAGKIRSLDQPVADFYPEWKEGKKKGVTLRHLLNHTSGLQADRTTEDIYASPDFVKLALATELATEPGSKFFYNNKAVNLLAGIVKVASGEPLDEYVNHAIFAPIGVGDAPWSHDQAGNPHAMSGLHLRPMDLARVGEMLALGGAWQGKRVVSQTWIDESTRPGQRLNSWCGLLWWIKPESMRFVIDDSVVDAWHAGGVAEAFVQRVLPMKDKVFERDAFFAELGKIFTGPRGLDEWYEATWKRGLPDGKAVAGPTVLFYADGWLGQFLVVVPRAHLVAVRMRTSGHDADEKAEKRKSFGDFPDVVRALAGLRAR